MCIAANFFKLSFFLFMKANMASQTLSSLMEENRMMNSEMNRLEDLLSQARAERDDIGIKYQAVSDRVSTILTSGHRCSVM